MLSTPLICCSMGVATACSIVSESAPTYRAKTWISGGAMLGNCETGRLTITAAPTMTVIMAITIATIGRLMKNLDIRFRTYPRSLTDLLHPFNDDALAWRKSLVDDPIRADRFSKLHGSDFHGVVFVDDGDLARALKIDDGALRNQECPFSACYRSANSSVQAGSQTVSGIWEQRRDFDG